MSNLNIRRWTPQPDGGFKARVFECGTYTKFDGDEPLNEWDNPFTGERIKVWNFLAGPLNIQINADGSLGAGAETAVRAKPQKFEVIGDTVFMPQASAFSYPNPFQPKDWPKESSGEKTYWDSHFLYMAKASDVADPNVTNAPAQVQLQNLVFVGLLDPHGPATGAELGQGLRLKTQEPRRDAEGRAARNGKEDAEDF